MSVLRLATEGDTAEIIAEVSEIIKILWWIDVVWIEKEVVGVGASIALRRPIVSVAACVTQAATWNDMPAPDKHQRRLHNSICISWGLGDEVGEATV